jgi:hypothetical protein
VSAKRSKPIAPPRAVNQMVGHEAAETDDQEPRLLLWLSLAWLVGFSLFFYSFTLPNLHVGRFLILFSLPDLLPVSQLASAPWGNLGQRADLFGIAALILSGAWGLGQLAMRIIRPPVERPPLERFSVEHTFFAMALGIGAAGLLTLGCGLAGLLNRWIFIGVFAAAIAGECFLRLRERGLSSVAGASRPPRAGKPPVPPERAGYPPLFWLTLGVAIPFLFVMWLGSMSPEADFDVGSYHFEGPKEYFQNGRITFLPHNVYTNFPFLTEMFALLGMVLHGDWYWGAVAGKCALFACAPLTALGLYAAGRRWFSPAAGLLAAVVYVTTPWITRVSIIALSEGGMTFFLFATLFAGMIAVERMHSGVSPRRWVLMTGLLAGCGMGCKYTGLLQVVLPAAIGLALASWFVERRRSDHANGEPADARSEGVAATSKPEAARSLGLNLAVFAAGVALTTGPWLLKNVWETGNPVYPLAYTIFGGRHWNPDLNAKFVPAHSPRDHHLSDLGTKLVDVMADNDWSSPLLFGLAPLALLAPRGRRISQALWLLVAYLFVTYWAFTHRIDRFWMPMIPVVALLGGIGAAWSGARSWVWGGGFLIALAVWFNLGFVAGNAGFCGYNALLTDRQAARRTAENAGDSFVAYLNHTLPTGAKVLSVGDSQVFDARFPVVYNTVFNPSIFQKWFAAAAPPGTSERDLPLKPASEILAKLHAEGITHIYVDWNWIRRYREPGNYGFTDFVTPARFDQLMADGVLRPPVSLGSMSLDGMTGREVDTYEASLPFSRQTVDGRTVLFTDRFGTLSDQDQAILKQLGPSLLTRADGREVLINAQVFAVR